jgi:hypothetical protein
MRLLRSVSLFAARSRPGHGGAEGRIDAEAAFQPEAEIMQES